MIYKGLVENTLPSVLIRGSMRNLHLRISALRVTSLGCTPPSTDPSKGNRPFRRAKSMIPKDHMSNGGPVLKTGYFHIS